MEGMGIAPWGALGGGQFKTKEQREQKGGRNFMPATEAELKLSEVLEVIAKRKGTIITSVAMAYVMHKTPYVFPICGGRTVEHLKGNIEALGLKLSKEDIDEIEGAVPFDRGFPHDFMSVPSDVSGALTGEDLGLTKMLGHFDWVKPEQAIPGGSHKADIEEAK
jgi:diketogulonate reductase-like aldo/keto reductase